MSDVENVIKSLVFNAGVNAAVKAAQTEVPFLGLPIVSAIFGLIVTRVADLIFTQLEKFVDFEIISFKTADEKKAYQEAISQLILAHGAGNTDAIEKAKSNFKSTLASLIHFDRV